MRTELKIIDSKIQDQIFSAIEAVTNAEGGVFGTKMKASIKLESHAPVTDNDTDLGWPRISRIISFLSSRSIELGLRLWIHLWLTFHSWLATLKPKISLKFLRNKNSSRHIILLTFLFLSSFVSIHC